MLAAPTLAFVQPHVSCVIGVPLDEAWETVRDWAPFAWLPQVDGRKVHAKLMSGGGNTAIGATRQVKIGEQQLHERLVALDDEEHILKWRLISHPDTTNPFTASFVNYLTTLRLEDVTIGSQTFLDWRGEFYTEPAHAEGMKDVFERWYTTAFKSLEEHVQQKRVQAAAGTVPVTPYVPMPVYPIIPPNLAAATSQSSYQAGVPVGVMSSVVPPVMQPSLPASFTNVAPSWQSLYHPHGNYSNVVSNARAATPPKAASKTGSTESRKDLSGGSIGNELGGPPPSLHSRSVGACGVNTGNKKNGCEEKAASPFCSF